MCGLQNEIENRDEVTNAITEISTYLTDSSCEIEGDLQLNKLLTTLADRLNGESPRQLTFFKSETNLIFNLLEYSDLQARSKKIKLMDFISKYSSAQQIDQLKKSEAARETYIKDVIDTLSATKIGKEVLECFQKDIQPDHKDCLGETVYIGMKIKAVVDKPFSGQYFASSTVPFSKCYVKNIELDISDDPLWSLVVMAHELQHGCDLQKADIYQQRMDRLQLLFNNPCNPLRSNPSPDCLKKQKSILADYYQEQIVDEMR